VCTIALYFQVFDEYPVVVGANRDERYARGSLAPQRLRKAPGIVGGQDEAAGGTWMGINEHGLWLGIANRVSSLPHDPGRRSRGQLCLDLLGARSCREARSLADRITLTRYNPFYLIAADHRTGFLLSVEADAAIRNLDPGLYVLTNSGLNGRDDPRRKRAWRQLSRMKRRRHPPSVTEWARLLSDHGDTPDDALCLHEPMRGTRSSTLFHLHQQFERSEYFFAAGPPCRSDFANYSDLLTQKQ
jgi:uncharacterized protein with NRDE domain